MKKGQNQHCRSCGLKVKFCSCAARSSRRNVIALVTLCGPLAVVAISAGSLKRMNLPVARPPMGAVEATTRVYRLLDTHLHPDMRALANQIRSGEWMLTITNLGPGNGAGFALALPPGRGLVPAISVDRYYLRNFSDRQVQLSLYHEYLHYRDLLDQMDHNPDAHIEDWIALAFRGYMDAAEARRNFDGEVRTYARQSQWAQTVGWTNEHMSCQLYATGGLAALADGLANTAIKQQLYVWSVKQGEHAYTFSIPPETVKAWAATYVGVEPYRFALP